MADADTLRIASFHTTLSADGPGLLLADIVRGDDPVIDATLAVIARARADIVVLQDIDHDAEGLALAALARELAARGQDYPFRLTLRPNTGRPTGHDLDGDGHSHWRRDAHGFGGFNGAGGMALLSRHPIGPVTDFTATLWRDLPGSRAAEVTPEAALPVLRLATVGAWAVEIAVPGGPVTVLATHAGTPVFDGPEDRNGIRNADELRFWQLVLDGWQPTPEWSLPDAFVLAGTLNVDPMSGEGHRDVLRALLDHPGVQEVTPTGARGAATADWADPVPGDLRVDYILPAATLTVTGHGMLWPTADEDPALHEMVGTASDHRLIWVDLSF